MQMNRTPSDSAVRSAVQQTVGALPIPGFDAAAIRRRVQAEPAAGRPSGAFSRRALLAAGSAVAVLVLAFNVPAVRAQMDRALQAFAVVNGQTVPFEVRTVSLDEARRQLPFEVIAPMATPAGLRLTIHELYSASSPLDSRLIFEYGGRDDVPAFSIQESSVRAKATKLALTERRTIGGPGAGEPQAGAGPQDGAAGPDLAPGPQPALGRPGAPSAYVLRTVDSVRRNGVTVTHESTIHPVLWVTRGTRITLAAPDGTLNPGQIAAIQAAMSH
jgi:hypothetical protein